MSKLKKILATTSALAVIGTAYHATQNQPSAESYFGTSYSKECRDLAWKACSEDATQKDIDNFRYNDCYHKKDLRNKAEKRIEKNEKEEGEYCGEIVEKIIYNDGSLEKNLYVFENTRCSKNPKVRALVESVKNNRK